MSEKSKKKSDSEPQVDVEIEVEVSEEAKNESVDRGHFFRALNKVIEAEPDKKQGSKDS